MNQQALESKPNGYIKQCRDCEKTIYLHRGANGPWRAYEAPRDLTGAEETEWVRHRCTAALQDAELLGIVGPPGSKPADFLPRLRRVVQDLSGLLKQAESRAAGATG
jgi:hypothetical protein